MSKEHDLLTVIIPTRERPDTLPHCLRTVVAQRDSRMEIIVSDNAGGPETKAVVDSFKDSRLRYIRPDARLGMSEHWEFALRHARGNWVTILGDDDGLMPGAANRFFQLTAGKGVEAVASQTCRFEWPRPVDGIGGKLIVRLGFGSALRDSKTWLEKVVTGREEFASLPYLYTGGFVHADVVRRVRKKSGGVFFNSAMPDGYSGLAVCSVTDTFLYTWEPLAVAGMSRHSNGRQCMAAAPDQLAAMPYFSENSMGFLSALGSGLVQSVPFHVYESFLRSAHLREGGFKTELEEQLALAVALASGVSRADITEYCRGVAGNHGLDFAAILARAGKLRLQRKAERAATRFVQRLRPLRFAKKVIAGDARISTIYDAVRVAGCIVDGSDPGGAAYIPALSKGG